MKPKNEQVDSEWNAVLAAADIVAEAHRDLLKSVDALAGLMEPYCWADDLLVKCLPLKSKDRRDSERILTWLEQNQEAIKLHMLERYNCKIVAEQRKSLMAKLNLNASEKKLLGLDKFIP